MMPNKAGMFKEPQPSNTDPLWCAAVCYWPERGGVLVLRNIRYRHDEYSPKLIKLNADIQALFQPLIHFLHGVLRGTELMDAQASLSFFPLSELVEWLNKGDNLNEEKLMIMATSLAKVINVDNQKAYRFLAMINASKGGVKYVMGYENAVQNSKESVKLESSDAFVQMVKNQMIQVLPDFLHPVTEIGIEERSRPSIN